MPEEQAFCVLVKIMYDYQLRKLFKHGFLELHLKFYQLERLMQVKLSLSYTSLSLSLSLLISRCLGVSATVFVNSKAASDGCEILHSV